VVSLEKVPALRGAWRIPLLCGLLFFFAHILGFVNDPSRLTLFFLKFGSDGNRGYGLFSTLPNDPSSSRSTRILVCPVDKLARQVFLGEAQIISVQHLHLATVIGIK
jgi:hypothetical protein